MSAIETCDLQRNGIPTSGYPSIEKLVHHQLETLSGIIDLEFSGSAVKPITPGQAEIRFGEHGSIRGEKSPLTKSGKRDSTGAYHHVEPRLRMIGHLLGCLKSFDGFRDLDGFRLRNLAFWARYPNSGILNNFGELSTWCSCDCDFCFLKGAKMLEKSRPMFSLSEGKTRLRYYSPKTRIGLPTPSASPGEPFTNPNAIELLRLARSTHPDHILDVTTCGDFLTEKTIDALAELKPIHIALSLNSSDVEVRRRIMRSHRAAVGIAAVPLLQSRGIQFTGSIVPSHYVPLDDVAETMRYLDRYSPLQIRLLLPGFTKYSSANARFDSPAFWDSLVQLAMDMRGELRSPILIQPGFYWNKGILATIDGILPNSPAAKAGLACGDRIIRVNNDTVITRAEAIHFLELPYPAGKPWKVEIEVERANQRFTVELSNELPIHEDHYPYKPRKYPASYDVLARWTFGMQFLHGFDLGPLRKMKQIIEGYPEVRSVLIFTTPLVKNLYAQALQIVGDSPECRLPPVEVRVAIASQNFWGGNILIGDLHVVQDYIDHLNLLKDARYRPDLAIIPSSFVNSWGFDILGTSYKEIERCTGIPVELLPVRRIMV